MSQPYKYFAFISYSRKDSKAAAWLQKRLEWFRFPVKLVPEDRRPPHGRFVRPIYRDKTNLEVTNEHYWTNIRRALEESRYLIVLCSPHSAKSEPVNMEVSHFLASHGDDATLLAPVIVGGNVTNVGDEAALCPALGNLGDSLITRNLPTMLPDATTAEPDAWEAGFVALISYLLKLERTAIGDHIQRETKRQAKILMRWFVAVGILALAAVISAWLAIAARREVEQQNQINLTNLHEASMADYAVAVKRIEKDDKWHEGVAHLSRALKWEPTNRFAAARLYSTLTLHAPERQTCPQALLRHEDRVSSAQFSPDGARIVTSSEDKTARVWDAATGKPLGESLRHEGIVSSAQFSPDSARIVTASWDKTGRVWDAATSKPLGEPLHHEDRVRSAQFSPDGTRIVTASSDKTARVWDAATGKPLGEPLRHEGSVWSAQFSPDGTRIVTTCDDRTARVWDAATGKPLGEPLSHEVGVVSAQFSPDGARIVTASYDKTARVWDAATGKPLGEPLHHEGSVRSAQFSPDGARIVTSSEDKTARVWDAATGKPLGEPLRHEGIVSSAQFSPDGARIVTASWDKTARVWDAATGKPLGDPLHHEGRVWSAQFSPGGTRIVTASDDNTARVWDAATLAIQVPVSDWLLQRAQAIAGLTFDADGQMNVMPDEQRMSVLRESRGSEDPWSRLVRWLALPAGESKSTPTSPFTFRQIAERERDSGTKEGLESALRYDPTAPLAHVLLAKFGDNPQRADFLRGYGLKLLPDDAKLWAQAAASLVQQKDFKRALQAAEKALKLDPDQAEAKNALEASKKASDSK